jgi:hypothetical protein
LPRRTNGKLGDVLVGVKKNLTKLFVTHHLFENHADVESYFYILVACQGGEDGIGSPSDVIYSWPS